MPKFENIHEVITSLQENFKADAAEGVNGIFQLSYTGDDGGDWHLHVRDQQLEVVEGVHENPDVTVTCAAKDWLKIANGDANAMMMMMMGKLKIKGSIPLATKLQSMFF